MHGDNGLLIAHVVVLSISVLQTLSRRWVRWGAWGCEGRIGHADPCQSRQRQAASYWHGLTASCPPAIRGYAAAMPMPMPCHALPCPSMPCTSPRPPPRLPWLAHSSNCTSPSAGQRARERASDMRAASTSACMHACIPPPSLPPNPKPSSPADPGMRAIRRLRRHGILDTTAAWAVCRHAGLLCHALPCQAMHHAAKSVRTDRVRSCRSISKVQARRCAQTCKRTSPPFLSAAIGCARAPPPPPPSSSSSTSSKLQRRRPGGGRPTRVCVWVWCEVKLAKNAGNSMLLFLNVSEAHHAQRAIGSIAG